MEDKYSIDNVPPIIIHNPEAVGGGMKFYGTPPDGKAKRRERRKQEREQLKHKKYGK